MYIGSQVFWLDKQNTRGLTRHIIIHGFHTNLQKAYIVHIF